MQQRARERPLGPALTQDSELRRCEKLPPLRFGVTDFEVFGGVRVPGPALYAKGGSEAGYASGQKQTFCHHHAALSVGFTSFACIVQRVTRRWKLA